MSQVTGWLFDLYARPDKGLTLWLVGEDGKPYSFHQDFDITFYAAGELPRLRELWRFLKARKVRLEYTRRADLFAGMLDVVQARVPSPAAYPALFRQVSRRFSDLTFYDADVALPLRFVAAHDVYMMAHCTVTARSDGTLQSITACEPASELDPALPPLRKLVLAPDADPARAVPRRLFVRYGNAHLRLPLDRPRELLLLLKHILAAYDPDVIQTRYGDTWLFSFLDDVAEQNDIPFNPNRDASMPVVRRRPISFFNYGRAHYRGPQVHLRGRWHIDTENCMTYGDYGLLGAIEETRMTGLPVQEAARRSPGAGIAALQAVTAMRRGVLVPYQSQKGEIPKSYTQLVRSDRGGLVLQPPVGLFTNVAILDFSSMMASIMIEFNVSPETAGSDEPGALDIPELGIKVSPRPGLMPCSLRPLRDKRLALKHLLRSLDKNDPRTASLRRRYKAVVDALKWLTVVAYGRLGFANSTFGRINSHEVVSYLSRQVVTRAKLVAEERGFTVLHLYVDSLFVTRPDATLEDFQSLAGDIERETHLPIELQKVYAWFAFLSTRENANVSVANRFYGLAPDGDHKIRGIALRRSDTPRFVASAQMGILDILARETRMDRLFERLPEVLELVREKLDALKAGRVPPRQLVVSQTLSRELQDYSHFSPAAIAARQLESRGKMLRMGQRVQFVHILSAPGVRAWDLPGKLDPRSVDVAEYRKLLLRAAQEVLQPLGVTEDLLKAWLFSPASYAPPGLVRSPAMLSNASYPLLALGDGLHAEVLH
jgi:DNA polymerase II